MKRSITWLLLLWGTTACNSTDDMDPTLLQGQFTGTFERTVDGSSEGVESISLLLEGNSFSGEGGANRYPTICRGTFAVEGNKVNFSNSCFFTADFDWTLILSGDFRVERDEDELILSKNEGLIVDMYRLVKK
ncbi:hypothetical protein Belba_0879 [Belliella baltica DSM 15883]|uniref:Lipocalin-like domain-containing protein n=1 Tax=Belliella baltica (strain DSM 15883 / CIP 108006 / LMG 21964 / BA134) TaxID=866536 RepID=I3Z2Q8_BELBD|nr:hypothetical protein [Belliella baltica]AFL83526.1 hypothetical protein Belba_0879 [Belliella baltica DSM 15883]